MTSPSHGEHTPQPPGPPQAPFVPGGTLTQRVVKDLLAGLTVSFVAISLGAAFGAFAGRGAMSGILSAGVIALICAVFGGTRIQCSGPTAPMSAVMFGAVVFAKSSEGLAKAVPGANPDHFLNVVLILTGATIFMMAVFRLGKFITLVPKVVISGFMNGIAVLIWIGEFKSLFGFKEEGPILGGVGLNVAIASVSIALCFGLPPLLKKIPKVGHFIPGTLAAIVLITAGVHLSGLEVGLVKMGAGAGSLGDLVQQQLPRDWSGPIILAALPFVGSLALLAYLDTLLTALVVDKKVKEDLGLDETSSQNKELAAQGLANAVVGLFGGIPGAQATIRSVLILKEGATMRLAGVAVGLFVLIEMVALQDLIGMIPSAVFSGVLIKVGYDVMDWAPLHAAGRQIARREPNPEAIVQRVAGIDLFFIVGTTALTIAVNLNVAVIAFVILFYVLKRASVEVPDLPALDGQAEEWVSDHQEGLSDAALEVKYDHDTPVTAETQTPIGETPASSGEEGTALGAPPPDPDPALAPKA
ncbi:MAG: SulP family inorganic anion transporter [Planctomycetes bacterium]|nr:SulP family inorganic anion transporter [Planctomycetota bacterium]